jgi:MFS family permease
VTGGALSQPVHTNAALILVFLALALAVFCNLYVYDSLAPVAELLSRQLGYSDTQIGSLNAIYSLPNIFLVVIGGLWIDTAGAAAVILWTSCICLLGACLTAVGNPYVAMLLGRFLFGIGAETLVIAVLVAVTRWFSGRRPALVLALVLSLARLGSYLADRSPTLARSLYAHGWQGPLVLAANIALVGLLAAGLFYWLDRRAARDDEQPADPGREVFQWRLLLRFPRAYWYTVGLCVTFYGAIYPFRSTFAIKYFQHTRGLSLEEASRMNSYVFMTAIFAMPLFGWLADRSGRHSLLLILGAIALPAAFLLLSQNSVGLWVPTAMLGSSFSIVPAVLWPTVPRYVTAEQRGSAYGLMTLIQNIGLTFGNLCVGWLNEHAGASAANPSGYLPMLWFFGTLGLAGTACALALACQDVPRRG